MSALRSILEQEPIEASAPCRIDMGGTLDLSSFYLPLHHLKPCTFNAALDLRTSVRLLPFDKGRIKIRSIGFDDLVVESERAPFDHPLGLMLAVAAYYQADGVAVEIQSTSPPRSALGGSSAAAAALIWAFSKALAKIGGNCMPTRDHVVLLAHAIEQSVAGVPCGMQDHLAAVYGGVNGWHWIGDPCKPPFERETVVPDEACDDFNQHLIVAYCGVPHVSRDVNGEWVRQFIAGNHRRVWQQIAACSRQFIAALVAGDFERACAAMNLETDLRRQLTPDVLDEVGLLLVEAARAHQCSARFTGAGAGGCIWALGRPDRIVQLGPVWARILAQRQTAAILKTRVDSCGLL